MANRAIEKLPAGTTPSDYGEAVTVAGTPSGTYALISMVTSPLTVHNRQDYVVISFPDAATPSTYPTEPDTYRWTVVEDRLPPPDPMDEEQTEFGWNWFFFEAPDTVHITVELEANGVSLATLTINQTVQARRADVDAWITASKVDRADAIHELVSDLGPYINASVVASGATGVPARLVAAILWQEMQHRWREDTDGAERYRKALAAGTAITGPEPGTLEKWFGDDDDLVREVELETAAMGLNAPLALGSGVLSGKSIGVGQIRQYIAAMVLCEVEWREKPPITGANKAERDEVDDAIKSDYKDLSLAKKVEVYNHLRFPKTCVGVVTKFLTLLKNRPRTGTTCGPSTTTRWKTMTRQAMVNEEQPCKVVAQEYNTGATNDSGAVAKTDPYGKGTWLTMSNVLPINVAAFFPEPP